MTPLDATPEATTPPSGEEIHLPGPSLLPLATAVGITVAVVGLTIWWVWTLLGGLFTLACIIKWIASTRRDIAELPPEHH